MQKSVLLLVFIILSSVFSIGFPSSQYVRGQTGTDQTPTWVASGAYMNYSAGFNAQASFTLSNGSKISLSESITGTYKVAIESVSNGYANVTTIPNVIIKGSLTSINGTTSSSQSAATPANATSSKLVPLSQLSLNNVTEGLLSSVNSSFLFSPTLNATQTTSPASSYVFQGSTIAVLELKSSISATAPVPSSAGVGGSYTITGSSDVVVSLANEVPLKVSIQLQGSASIQALQTTQGAPPSGTGAGSLQLNIELLSTNIDLSTGNSQQAKIPVPSYSASVYVLSNSTIESASTNGNELVVNVTGPTGTTGVLDVIISQGLMQKAGITNLNQIGVRLDGQPYSNYTVTTLGGNVILMIYYHHSSHAITVTLGSANLGSNQGTLSYVVGGPTGTGTGTAPSQGSSFSWLFVLPIIGVLIVVVVLLIMIRNRSKQGRASDSSPTPAPSAGSPGETQNPPNPA